MFKQNINDNIKIKQEIESENKILRIQYEDAFKNANKNRPSINKQLDESEEDYIQRMNELENEKYSTVLYKEKAILDYVIKLKDKLKEFLQNDADIENIIKDLSDNEIFLALNFGN